MADIYILIIKYLLIKLISSIQKESNSPRLYLVFNELRVVVSQIKCHATKLKFYKIVVCLVKSESHLWNFWYDWIKSAAICFVLTLYNYSVV